MTMHIDIEVPLDLPATDAAWVRTCTRRLLLLDPRLDPTDAEAVAMEMCELPRWRERSPELAATMVVWARRPGSPLSP